MPDIKYILAIESSCDDTSAAVLKGNEVLSNVIANQEVHKQYGGVVPELASRAHQAHIVPVVDRALKESGIEKSEIQAVAFTKGPGLLGSLLVGCSFAKALAISLNIPLIGVDHMQAHILAHFIYGLHKNKEELKFPFIALTVSGGHTQLVKVSDFNNMQILGRTLDDAAGEAFDKCGKMLGLDYPAGPEIDKLSRLGSFNKYTFPISDVPDLNYSFSGLKTSVLYFLQKQLKKDPNFIKDNINDLCSSIQHCIVQSLLLKLEKAIQKTGINQVVLCGGVSANSGLRLAVEDLVISLQIESYDLPPKYCTDNAAMIGIAAFYKAQNQLFEKQNVIPNARLVY